MLTTFDLLHLFLWYLTNNESIGGVHWSLECSFFRHNFQRFDANIPKMVLGNYSTSNENMENVNSQKLRSPSWVIPHQSTKGNYKGKKRRKKLQKRRKTTFNKNNIRSPLENNTIEGIKRNKIVLLLKTNKN